jgi:uncharacterized protein
MEPNQTVETLPESTAADVAEATEAGASAPIKQAPDDIKAKTPMEHWLRRQIPGHTLKGILEALKRLESGVPVPFLAFYGFDDTDGLKSDDLYRLLDLRAEWEEIARKQAHLLQEIQSQGKLTEELKQQIERSSDLDRLEDLYAPFKLKRQTLGVQAREAGLGAFADYLWATGHGEAPASEPAGATLEEKAATFAKPDTKYTDAAAVLKGAQDILVERIAEAFELRSLVRSTVLRRSKIRAAKGPKAKPNSKYTKFFEYQEPIGSLKKGSSAHRYLAMRRGWMEDELVLSFDRPDEGVLLEKFEEFACPNKEAIGRETLVQAARLALKGNVYTVMENEAHRHMKEEAERHVIQTLAENLRKKLLRPGMGRKAVMGIDPGSGNHPCSLALVDADGKLILNMTFKVEEAATTLAAEFLASLENLKIEAIAVAHGPRSKEVRDLFKTILAAGRPLPIVAVHEHTSSIYCSSPAAKEEFPSLDVNTRRAVFVARYLQDPLSVILRLDPKFLSLGEFQHEVNQGDLRKALQRAIEASVNFAGIDPNYAPAHVLSKVSGVSNENAKALIQFRETSGKLKAREDIKTVPGMASHFDHCAGFLRITESAERLDTTFVHPMHYEAVKAFLAQGGDPAAAETNEALVAQVGKTNAKHYAYELAHVGEDPRGAFSIFEYDPSLKGFADLKKDTPYPGVVTNVTSFGAFVDIGIEQDGLVHISELTDVLAKNPFDALFPGDPVTVFVANVNEEKKQISLTMRQGGRPARGERGRPRGERGAGGGRPRGDRRPRGPRSGGADRNGGERPPQGAPGEAGQVAAGAEGAEGAPSPDGQPRDFRGRGRGGPRGERGERGDRGPREFRGRGPRPEGGGEGGGPGGPGGERGKREDRAPRKARKPMRDSKTGAIVKMDEDDGRMRGGPKLPSKSKPMAFNPFANLGDLLKKDKP